MGSRFRAMTCDSGVTFGNLNYSIYILADRRMLTVLYWSHDPVEHNYCVLSRNHLEYFWINILLISKFFHRNIILTNIIIANIIILSFILLRLTCQIIMKFYIHVVRSTKYMTTWGTFRQLKNYCSSGNRENILELSDQSRRHG